MLWLMAFSAFFSSTPSVSLVLSNGDDEAVFYAVLSFHHAHGWLHAPTLIAMEPGPLVLERGLRLLPNEIPPRLSPTDVLVINHQGNLLTTDLLIAFVRRCLNQGTHVIIVGEHFPRDLLDGFLLEPGQTIDLESPRALTNRLLALAPPPEPPAPVVQIRLFAPWLWVIE